MVLAGGFPIAEPTALKALEGLEFESDNRLLITGGSGTTGGIAVQLAAQG